MLIKKGFVCFSRKNLTILRSPIVEAQKRIRLSSISFGFEGALLTAYKLDSLYNDREMTLPLVMFSGWGNFVGFIIEKCLWPNWRTYELFGWWAFGNLIGTITGVCVIEWDMSKFFSSRVRWGLIFRDLMEVDDIDMGFSFEFMIMLNLNIFGYDLTENLVSGFSMMLGFIIQK